MSFNLTRRTALLGATATGLSACAGSTQSAPHADYVFDNVHVVPMNAEGIVRNQAVFVRNGMIEAIAGAHAAARMAAQWRIDAAGAHLMPALADMHIHLRTDPQRTFNLFLANGVTTVRNLNDTDGGYDHIQIRRDVAEGRLIGPRYLAGGPFLDSGSLRTLADVPPMLDLHQQRGFDFVKIHDNVSQEIYDAVIEGARERGLRTVGHAQRDKPLAQTLRQGCIEHAEEFLYVSGHAALSDPAQRRAIADQVAASGVPVCPTLIIYFVILTYADDARFASFRADPRLAYLPSAIRTQWTSDANPYRRAGWREQLAAALPGDVDLLNALVADFRDAGVPMLLGADAFGGVVPGFSIHQELALLVAAGLSPYQALRTGTANVGAYLNEPTGIIAPGRPANFILVDGNPLADIAAASRVQGVFTQNRWRDKAAIDASLDAVRAAYA
jgi:imidazolonepropionase-like amidohydrolase